MKRSTRIVHWYLGGGQTSEYTGLQTERIPGTNPIFCMRFLTMIGYSVPPKLEPKAMTPNARPTLRLNQCAGVPIRIPKITPHES